MSMTKPFINIKQITATNFMSFKEVTLNVDDRGLVLIEGVNNTNESYISNGSGKSNLNFLIVYAIFEKTSKGIKGESIIREGQKKMTLKANVVIGDDTYTIERSSQRVERKDKPSTAKSKVTLYQNGKDITAKSVKDTNEIIKSLFNIEFNTFINSLFFGNEATNRFSTQTDAGRKELLEDLINLSAYSKAQEVAKEKVKEQDIEINQVDREKDKLQWSIDNTYQQEKEDQEKYNATLSQIETYKQRLNHTKEEKDKALSGLSKIKDRVIQDLHQVDKQLEEYTRPQSIQTEERDKSKSKVEAQQRMMDGLKQTLSQLQLDKQRYKETFSKLTQSETCYVCGNKMNEEHRKKEIKKIHEDVTYIKGKEESITNQIAEESILLQELQSAYQIEESKVKGKLQEQQSITEQWSTIQRQRSELQAKLDKVKEKESSYDSTIQSLESNIQALYNVPTPQSRQEERNTLQEELNSLQRTIATLEEEKRQYQEIVKIYSNEGIRSHVLDFVTPSLNKVANYYLNTLSGGDIEVVFTTQKRNKDGTLTDKFDIQVHTQSGASSIDSLSTGERKRVDLSISLAIQELVLSKSNLSTNFTLYDECFDGLDSIGCENVIHLLKERLQKVPTIFVITHNESLKNLFEKVITVEKTNGISKLIETEVETEKEN